jgi:hypothetical protein
MPRAWSSPPFGFCGPKRAHCKAPARKASADMRAAGSEKRLVNVSQRARRRVSGKIRTKPFLFRVASLAADGILTLAIQHYDVPCTEFVAVVAGVWVAGSGAKISEVRYGARGMNSWLPTAGRDRTLPGRVAQRQPIWPRTKREVREISRSDSANDPSRLPRDGARQEPCQVGTPQCRDRSAVARRSTSTRDATEASACN